MLSLPVVTVSPDSGTYIGSVSVTMNATNANEIFYTLDGTTPNDSSIPYTETFEISAIDTTEVKAVAINSVGSSPVVSKTYVIEEASDNQYVVSFKKPNNWNTAYIYLFDKNANIAIPGFPAWPGIQMSKLGNSPWYEYTIDQSIEVGIVFNDNGGAQTDNLFRTTSGWYDNQWLENCPGDCPDTVDASFKVYFKKPTNWNTAYVYLYDENTNAAISGFPAWPGIQMSKLGNSAWYEYAIDQSVAVGIVFNDNGGSQTSDLFRTTAGWYDNQWFDTCPGECPSSIVVAGKNVVFDSNDLSSLKVSPNPFENVLTLSFASDVRKKSFQVLLYDLNGKRIKAISNKDIKTRTFTLNTAYLPKGIYLLKVTSNTNSRVIKLVK